MIKVKTKEKIKRVALVLSIVALVIVLALGLFKVAASAEEIEAVAIDSCSIHYWDDTYTCINCGWSCPHTQYDEQGVCITCGFLCAGVYDQGSGFAHSFGNNGVCEKCGYECQHSNTTTMSVETIDKEWHNVYLHCNICGVDVVNKQPHTHASGSCYCNSCKATYHWYDNGVCTECGEVCAHSFGNNGVCENCGYECQHSDTTTMSVETIDEEWHNVYLHCNICGVDIVNKQPHTHASGSCYCNSCKATYHWYDNGVCTECGKVCAHSFVGDTCTECLYVCTHEGYMDLVGTDNVYHVAGDSKCGFCNLEFGFIEKHIYSDGVCSVCSWVCTHDYVDGTCKHCNMICSHSAIENVFVPNDHDYHSNTTRCSDCMMVLYIHSATHTFDGDVCKYCGYEKPHMFVLSADKTCYVCSGCGYEHPAKLVSKDVEHFSHHIQITPYLINKTQLEGEYYGDSGITYRRFISTEIIPSVENNSGNFGFRIDLNCPDVNGSYKYAVIKMRTNTPLGDLHTFWRFVVNFGNGDINLRLDKNAVCTNEWVTYVVDLSAFNSGKVPDKLIAFQLMDFYGKGVLNNNSYEGYYVDVSYAALVDDLHDVVDLLDTDNVSFSTSAGTSTTYSESQFDDMSHNFDYKVVWLGQKEHSSYKECTICGVRREYLGVQPHRWNGSGKCSFCLYVCKHTFSNGTCTNCAYVCPHKDLSITKRTYIDTSYHEDLWECAKCDYSYIDKQPHVFAIGDTQGDSVDDYKCEHCKHYVIIAENYYEIGYNQGLADGADMDSGSVAQGMIFGIYDGMTNTFFSMLNYEIFGINIASLIISLAAIALVVFVVKKVI